MSDERLDTKTLTPEQQALMDELKRRFRRRFNRIKRKAGTARKYENEKGSTFKTRDGVAYFVDMKGVRRRVEVGD